MTSDEGKSSQLAELLERLRHQIDELRLQMPERATSPADACAEPRDAGAKHVRDTANTSNLEIPDDPRIGASPGLMEMIAQRVRDGVFAIDGAGSITLWNPEMERISGFPARAVLGRSARIVFSRMTGVGEEPELHRALAGEEVVSDRHSYSAGSSDNEGFCESRYVPVPDGACSISGVIGFIRDVTKEFIQKASLESKVRELEQRTREMTLLGELGDMLRACLSTDEAYFAIRHIAQRIFPIHVGALYVIAPSRKHVEAAAIWGDASLAERVFPPDDCWALRRGRVHWVEDPGAGLCCKHLHQRGPDGYLCIPMMAQSEALGMLHFSLRQDSPLTEAKKQLAVGIAEQIALTLSRLRLQESLRSQSIHDPLTNLFNRRFMEEMLDLQLRRALRSQRPLGIIMLDIDGFKYFNDTYGHEAGDILLHELGGILRSRVRGEDIACRYGGEEFTLIMPESGVEVLQQRAEQLRNDVRGLKVGHRGHPLGPITASFGLAVFPEYGRTGDSLLRAADAALFRSKREGGDRVSVAGGRS